MERIKARFVGGPWHNRVIEVSRLNYIAIPEYRSTSRHESIYDEPFSSVTHYRLCEFVSGRGAAFFQYLHESVETDRESATFPPLPRYLFDNFLDALFAGGSLRKG